MNKQLASKYSVSELARALDGAMKLELIVESDTKSNHKPERRSVFRKRVILYMRVVNDDTGEILGHMTDISTIGFRLDTVIALPLNKDYYIRFELTPDIANIPYIVFIAQTRWCAIDNVLPNHYHVGFRLKEIMPDDLKVFIRIFEEFGK